MILSLITWLCLLVVSTLSFDRKLQFSNRERQRLADARNKAALDEQEYTTKRPLYVAFRQILMIVATVFFVVSLYRAYDTPSVLSLSVIGLLVVLFIRRFSFMKATVQRLYRSIERYYDWTVEHATPVLRLFAQPQSHGYDMQLNSREELTMLLEASPGILTRDEERRLEASFGFDKQTVASIMTPRSMICAIDEQEALGPLVLDELYKTGHSRFPVYRGDLDHMVGMLYLRDLVDTKRSTEVARTAMHAKVYFIRDDHTLSQALKGFLTTHQHVFVVINKYRETVGLLSLEDVMEVLLGQNIRDEDDVYDDIRAVAEKNPHHNNQPRIREDI